MMIFQSCHTHLDPVCPSPPQRQRSLRNAEAPPAGLPSVSIPLSGQRHSFSIPKYFLFPLFLFLLSSLPLIAQQNTLNQKNTGIISGKVFSEEAGGKQPVFYATAHLKNTAYGATTNKEGIFQIQAPAGTYTLVVSLIGYESVEKEIHLKAGERIKQHITLRTKAEMLNEVVISSNGVSRTRRSAFNTVAVDTRDLQNSTRNLSDALAKAPGLKVRESGGVGSDMQFSLDGFSGKHVKVFIDGIPQEGVGSSFGLNNIPVNFAERIEVYKGVVPVQFGTDAIGGVINIITKKKRNRWFVDAAYSYGSFNTHKSHLNFGQTLKNGFTYEINAFQNYSDNNYQVDVNPEIFTFHEDGSVSTYIDNSEKVRVKRFHDTYHNEAVVAKFGVVDKPWADRLMFGMTFSHMYQDIQTGVRQNTVYGEKFRRGYSLMPSLEYSKRNLFTQGLDLVVTLNYNRNATTNVDTSSYHYNWFGERYKMNTSGEQSRQFSRADNDNLNGTLGLNYRLGKMHMFSLNHVFNAFHRQNTSFLSENPVIDPIAKVTRKNITGLSYRLMPSRKWNLSVFGKFYHQYISGPIAEDETQSNYIEHSRHVSSFGYGAAGTYFIVDGLQAKLSYEKAYRLPTIEEMFGNEDLEMGEVSLRPENSHNLNFNLSYNRKFGKHGLYLEGSFVYRNTRDYIQRNISDLSGGKEAATYVNYGKVETIGYNLSARYSFSKWFSLGGNLSHMNVRDRQKTMIGTTTPNLAYGARMPNVPYLFADADFTFYWRDLGKKGNVLSITYDNQYLHSFSYYSEIIGSSNTEYIVPDQFSHNISIAYSIGNGRYNFSFECRNFTNEDLYDNFSLQKAGRAFYGKIRVHFGN